MLQAVCRHEDLLVFLLHLNKLVAEVNHGLLVCYDEFVVCFADPEELVDVDGSIIGVEAVPNGDSFSGEVISYVHDFIEVLLRNGGGNTNVYSFFMEGFDGLSGIFPSAWNTFDVIILCFI